MYDGPRLDLDGIISHHTSRFLWIGRRLFMLSSRTFIPTKTI